MSAGTIIESENASVRGAGIEDIAIEQVQGIARELVRDPGKPPGRQQRIADVLNGVIQLANLRIGHVRGQSRVHEEHPENLHDEPPPAPASFLTSVGRRASEQRVVVAQRSGRARRGADRRGHAPVERLPGDEKVPQGGEPDGPQEDSPLGSNRQPDARRFDDESTFECDEGREEKQRNRRRVRRPRPERQGRRFIGCHGP